MKRLLESLLRALHRARLNFWGPTSAEFAAEWIRDYRLIWPNGCPVCAFDRNWRNFGGSPVTPPHTCPEGNDAGVCLCGRTQPCYLGCR